MYGHGMIIHILVPFFVCVVGLLAYALSTNSKVAELGRIAYAFGLLVTLWHIASATFKF